MIARRVFSVAAVVRQPATVPFKRPILQPGDLVVIAEDPPYRHCFTPGVVIGAAYPECMVRVAIDAKKGVVRSHPDFIRFYYPQALTRDSLVSDPFAWIGLFKEHAQKLLAGTYQSMSKRLLGMGELIYEEDLAEDKQPVSLYLAHRFLYQDSVSIAKDHLWQLGGPYHRRSLEELRLQSLLDGTRRFPALIDKIFAFLLKKTPSVEWSEQDIDALKALQWVSSTCWHNLCTDRFIYEKLQAIFGIPFANQGAASALATRLDLKKHAFVHSPAFKKPRPVDTFVYNSACANRTDFQHLRSFAIDPKFTLEVDDAVSFEERNGEAWLHVHVADPTSVIPFGSDIDKLAREAASSVYLPDVHYSMLGQNVAKPISLCTSQAALTFSAALNTDGDIKGFDIQPSRIARPLQLTYEEADNPVVPEELKKIRLLSEKHLQWRRSQEYIDLAVQRSQVRVLEAGRAAEYSDAVVDSEGVIMRLENGAPDDCDEQRGCTSKGLVSEAMIIAGRVASMYAMKHEIPIVYRYHNPPEPSHELQGLFAGEKSPLATYQLLKHFSASAVDTSPGQHWAMALPAYSRVTSPLRRYFDMLTHRQLHCHLAGKPLIEFPELAPIYRREQYIRAHERFANRYWLHRYLDALGKDAVFEGTVVEHGYSGVIIQLKHPAMIVSALLRPIPPLGATIRFKADHVDLYRRQLPRCTLLA